MPRLEIEITDKLMERLQKDADIFAVEPSDVAKNIISCAFATKKKPDWTIGDIIEKLAKMVLAAKEQKQTED